MTYCEQNSVNRPFGQEPQSPVAGSGEDEDGDLEIIPCLFGSQKAEKKMIGEEL